MTAETVTTGTGAARAPSPGEASAPARDPRWARPALLALLAATAVLLLWDLGASGWANSYYAAAAQAGGESWKAFLFGSTDAANALTVDKPPAALWPMGLSVRLFGLGSWQILVPEALMGVGTVALLYAAVRRRFGAGAGLLAGGALALTPVAALMFRFDNPDALLALLMVAAVYAAQRALEHGRTRWLVLAGALLGLGFLTKALQAWLIVPPLALVHLCRAPVPWGRRVGQLLLGGLALVVTAGWWVALAELWPASSRPYIGGSQHNSFLELTFGYNGFGRVSGNETGSLGGTGNATDPGPLRMFSAEFGGQIGWLLPAALILLVAGLALTRGARRDPFWLWGGALLMTLGTFSVLSGIFHAYYTVALAPYIAALTGMGGAVAWRERSRLPGAAALALATAVTAVWAYVLLGRSAEWLPWLRWVVLLGGLTAAFALLVASALPRRCAGWAAALAVAAALAGPAAYSLDTVTTPHTGALVTAGPTTGGGPGGPGGPGGFGGGPGGGPGGGAQGKGKGQGQGPPPGGGAGAGGPTGGKQGPTGSSNARGSRDKRGQRPGASPGGPGAPGGRGGQGGGPGAMLNGTSVGTALAEKLREDASAYTWVAATTGSSRAASYQLAARHPVMAVGGFNGTDPAPTLAQFKEYVRQGRIHYFVAGSGSGAGGGGRGGTGSAAKIEAWVKKHHASRTVDGTTLYDLTERKEQGKEQGEVSS